MKKIIPILFVFFLFYGFVNKEEILIPTDAIRFRVIANSNDPMDQNLKIEVKNALEEELNKLMVSAKNSQEAKEIIRSAPANEKPRANHILRTKRRCRASPFCMKLPF